MNNLKELRKQRGIKQQTVASYLNISRSAYSHYEGGQRNMTPETLIKLSEFFDISIDYLLGNIDIPLSLSIQKTFKSLEDGSISFDELKTKENYDPRFLGQKLDDNQQEIMINIMKLLKNEIVNK